MDATMAAIFLRVASVFVLCAAGCAPSFVNEVAKEREKKAQEEAAKKDEFIVRKTTQEIGKFDPAEGREVSDSKVRATNPVTGALEAYGPMIESISKLQVDSLVLGYYAEHGKYPTYDEFMTKIVKQHNVQLPVLPGKMQYQYDEANHKLVVVYPEKKNEASEK